MPLLEFSSPSTLPPTANYSHVVSVAAGARILHISGQVPLDEGGRLVGKDDFEAQATQVFRNLEIALQANGAGFGDLVKIGLYVTDIGHLQTLRRVRDRFISGTHAPASTLLQVSAFFHPDILFEMDAVAAVAE